VPPVEGPLFVAPMPMVERLSQFHTPDARGRLAVPFLLLNALEGLSSSTVSTVCDAVAWRTEGRSAADLAPPSLEGWVFQVLPRDSCRV
jgi:hypothetical protein